MEINALIRDFNRITSFCTPHSALYFQNEAVYTRSYISKGVILGEIIGRPMNIWDIKHGDYIMVNDEYVIDVSDPLCRSIVTFIREENSTPNVANCTVVTSNDKDGTLRCFMETTEDIFPHTELVYFVV